MLNSLIIECTPAAVAFAAVLILTPLAARLGRGMKITAKPAAPPNGAEIPATGGISIIASIMIALAATGHLGAWVAIGAGAMFVVGLVDDTITLRPWQKFSCQLAIAAWAALFALPRFAFTPWQLLCLGITIFWLVATTNAFNLVDGLDGLAAGIGITAAGAIATVGLVHGIPAVTAPSFAVAAALAGFLIFNFPPASIIMGDAGALPLGYILGVLALKGAALATGSWPRLWIFPGLAMLVPLLDTAIVTATRLATGRAISRRGLDHAHDRLLSLGLSDRRAVAATWLMGMIAAGCAVATNLLPHPYVIVALPFIALATAVIGLFICDLTFDASAPGIEYEHLPGLARFILSLGYKRRVVEAAMDATLISAAYFGAVSLRLDFNLTPQALASMTHGLPWVVLLTYPAFLLAGVYRGIWRHAGLSDAFRFVNGAMLAGILVAMGSDFLPIRHSGSIAVLYALLLVNLLVATRSSFQVLRKLVSCLATVTDRVLVVGAGEAGTAAADFVFRTRARSARIVGFADVDTFKHGKLVQGEKVLGTPEDIDSIHAQVAFTEIIVADEKLAPQQLETLHRFARAHGIPVRRFSMQLNETQELAPREAASVESAAGGVALGAARPI
jgi:UDP-N-acetylmuramyl pentapeptide phosphotransferase/UDP-N-acetylglucosamine-1-phosphate transferase